MPPLADYHIEVECFQLTKDGESVCGDYFEVRKIVNENRTLAVLSDGLGSGIKANLLSTITATMALKFFREDMNLSHASRIIMDTLPVCEERKISYATFTAVDIRHDGRVRIIEMDNPSFVHLRNGRVEKHESSVIESVNWPGRSMVYSEFQLAPEDRIVFVSDGVTQAGIGGQELPFGWGDDNLADFVSQAVERSPDVSAARLSSLVVKTALSKNAKSRCVDDTSCASIYFRRPRKTVMASGPPFHKESDAVMARLFDSFEGRKLICGGTTASILGRELKQDIEVDLSTVSQKLPPLSRMKGVEAITEGILTLTELCSYLESGLQLGVDQSVKTLGRVLMESDYILFLIGTRVNEAHQDPSLPVDLEIRRNVLKRIMKLLEEKFNKSVVYRYL